MLPVTRSSPALSPSLSARPATRRFALALAGSALFLLAGSALAADKTLLNVSYDVSRELYKDINPAFERTWKQQTGEDLKAAQARAIYDQILAAAKK